MRTYMGNRSEIGDYKKIHDFLVKSANEEYTYGRFDWMMTNWEYLEDQYLNRIGIWEDNKEIVGATMFDHELDIIFPIVLHGYEYLYSEMIDYARNNMVRAENPNFMIYAGDHNKALVDILKAKGFIATECKDMVALFDLKDSIPAPDLREGYSFITLGQNEDYEKYLYCMFQGFGHAENNERFHYDKERENEMKAAYNREFLDKNLKISIVNQEGDYVAHCGMWYDKNSEIALIEPVCVVPQCRKIGLGREVVYEGLRRVKAAGAKRVVVGSGQQFYYSIGMVPFRTGSLWKEIEK